MKHQLIAAALAALLLFTVGCGAKDTGDENVVNVYNWGEYIDESLLADFETETGIRVNYHTFPSNEMLYSSIKSGSGSYDVIIPSDYMVARMIHEDMLLPLDYDKIPNFANTDPAYRNLAYDPQNQYTVPYMWGVTGIIYNTAMTDQPFTSWMDLFTTDLRGQVLMFDNPRDCIGIALKALGYSFNTTNPKELDEATALLIQQKEDGIVQSYVMDQIFDKMINNEAAVGVYYAGDYLTMVEENPDLAFAIPKEGTNLFFDAMCIPTCATHVDNAHAFIDFISRDDVILRNCDYIGYSTASATAFAAMDEEMSQNPIAYPDKSVIAASEVYDGLPQDTLTLYDREWVYLGLAKIKFR
ncbi:MAG: ABC transporter substrate-binding protein [Oscillospiraceae bacterium]